MGDSHKNDIPSFQRFLEKFCAQIEKRTDTDDDVPIRLASSFLVESEIEGECLDWVLQYLSTNKCPSALATVLARSVCDELLKADLSELFEEGESFHSTDTDLHVEKTVPQIDCHQLAKVIFRHLYSICERWNRELPEIAVPKKQYEVYSHAIKNTRRKMEDRHVIFPDLNTLFNLKNDQNQSYYAVFDGHGGVEAAIYAASHLHCHMVKHADFDKDPTSAIKHAYNNTDNMFLEKAQREGLRSGSTCVTALIRGDQLHLAWLGDSQAVLVKGGQLYDVMNPHKPERADEKKRIEDLGGVVVWFGTWRVNGNIAVSRAIGDIEHKPYISGEPDLLTMELDGTEDYLILGCDGVWDTIPKDELPEIMYTYLQECEGDRTMVAQRLVSIARDNGSTDNISVVIIFFKDEISEPKPTEESVEETSQPEAKDEGKGDNCDGKENSSAELPPHDPSSSNGSLGNGNGMEKKCSFLSTGKQKNGTKLITSKKVKTKSTFKPKKRKKTKPQIQKEPGLDHEMIRKPLRSDTQTLNKSGEIKNKRNESTQKETIWAFTGKSIPRVKNHRLELHTANKKSIVNCSYMTNDWLTPKVANILDKPLKEEDHKVPTWYEEEGLNRDSRSLPQGYSSTVCGRQSMLFPNQGRECMSGLQYQKSK